MKKARTPKNVAIVGLGYVGLPLAILADRRGYDVIGIDLDTKKIAAINKRTLPPSLIPERGLALLLKKSSLRATADFGVLRNVDIVVICVPTPVHEDYRPDLGPVQKACESIGKHLKKGQLVILESTVNPGVCDEVAIPILEKTSGLTVGKDFFMAHCPERINPGDLKWNVENIPRVVGGFNTESLQRAAKFYRSIVKAPVKEMESLKEAEAVKIVENSFRDINIAFVNELAMSFAKLGIDVVNVINGAATKPFAFMAHYPGAGVGGHCIPVDPYYLIEYAKQNGFRHEFLSLARKINNQMPNFTVGLLLKKFKEKNISPAGSKVAVLGLAYKPDVADDRESPAYEVIAHLQAQGIETTAYDPYLPAKSTKSLRQALQGTQGVIITTAHKEFRDLKPEYFSRHGVGIVIDGRNCFNKQEFLAANILYGGIGR